MPMKPHKDESQSEFMSRCVPEMIGSGSDKRPQEQAVAICLDIWRNRGKQMKQSAPDPEVGESHSDFMDRCVSELEGEDDAEELCQVAWEDRRMNEVVHKTHAGANNGMEFVLSDQSVDRMGDVIMAGGWKLANFKRNPIALFGHRSDFPIGRWRNLRVEENELRGHLELAPKGTSARIDEIIALVDAGILKAVSVGFKPIKHEPLDSEKPFHGSRFLEQELVETSLVSVPANANALAVAKSLKISAETIDLVFAEQGSRAESVTRRGYTAEQGRSHRNGKGRAMSLAQRISDLQVAIVAKRDALTAHMTNLDDSNVSDADLQTTNDLNADIARMEKQHTAWVESEKLLAKSTGEGNGSRALSTVIKPAENGKVGAPVIMPNGRKKDLDLLDHVVRAGVVAIRAKEWNRPTEDARQRIYGNDDDTKQVCDIILRAASAPALTTVTGWATELVQPRYEALLPLLMPQAILTRLAPKGLALDFGRAGKIVIPTRQRTPSLAGSFVGEGLPIPVRQGAFTSMTLTPKKVAVISVWSREMDEYSTPAIEGVLREAIQTDTSVAVDSVLIDANPATAVRPAGLLNGVSVTTATGAGGLNALVTDIKNLIGAITTATYGNIRSLVWLMNPAEKLSASLTGAANTGVYPFKEEVARGTLNGIPIIDSSTVPVKTVILIDTADFVSVGGGAPRFETSDSATLHMEDTTPLELVGTGSPGTVASPQRSLFQTDSIALRMVMPLNWANRRTGTVAYTTSVTW